MALGETFMSIGSSMANGAITFGGWTINKALPAAGVAIEKTAVFTYTYFFQPLGAGLFYLGKLGAGAAIDGGKWTIAVIAANPVTSGIVAGFALCFTIAFFLGRASKNNNCPHCKSIRNPRPITVL